MESRVIPGTYRTEEFKRLKEQDEISFKAGIRIVVGWIDKPCPHTGGLEEPQMRATDCPRCWEEAKKEWGVNDAS